MVAHTSPDCLPYFEVADSPCVNTGTVCEPSTVWCDLAELLDARFTAWDSVLGRTAVSVPFAQVRRTTPVTASVSAFDGSLPLTWEESAQDNDGMVDLTIDPQAVYIRRPGIWVYHFTAVLSSTVASCTLACQVDSSVPSVVASGRATWVQAAPSTPDNFEGVALMFDEPFLVSEADMADVSAISLRARITTDVTSDVTLYEATASVYWFAEAPS